MKLVLLFSFSLRCLAGYPPLVQAVVDGDAATVQAVIDQGVDVNQAMTEAFGRSTGATALMVAVLTAEQPSNREELVAMLLEAGAEVDKEADDGLTALRIACQNNLPSTAAQLLRAGAGPDGTASSGNPLTIAAQLGHVDVATELIEAGAWLDAHSPEPIDATPLLMAASQGQVAMVRLLVEAGASLALENTKGVTPHMGVALQALRGQTTNAYEVMELLLNAGAPASALEATVLARPPSGVEAIELLRRRREEQRADAPRVLMEKLRAMLMQRWYYLPLLAIFALWQRRRRQQPDATAPGAGRSAAAPAARPQYLYRLARQSDPARGALSDRTMGEIVTERQLSGDNRSNWSMDLLRGYRGAAGLDDKFMHMSTAEQVPGTADLYFGDAEDLMLLKFSTAKLEREGSLVRFEEAQPPAGTRARPGGFPHVYPPKGQTPSLSYGALVSSHLLTRGADGKCIFPPGVLDSGGADEEEEEEEEEEDDDDDEDDDDEEEEDDDDEDDEEEEDDDDDHDDPDEGAHGLIEELRTRGSTYQSHLRMRAGTR